MSKLEKLDLMGVTSLAAVAAVLLVGWIVTTQEAIARARPAEPVKAVTLTHDGAMKLKVTAARESDRASPALVRTASVRPSTGPSLDVALPFALRP
jgi:hypothetical protein